MNDTAERVRKVVVKQLKVDEEEIKPESRFVQDLGAESIQSIELVAAFEEEFDIDMEEDAALKVQTVAGAVEFIDRALADKG